jgi:hypothetical protein
VTTNVFLLVGLVVLVSLYITWTAGRLDRMHARVDASWAALDAQLVRRAAAARALLPHLPAGPETDALAARAVVALGAGEHGRDVVENALTRALRAAVRLLPDTPAAGEALTELEAASTRVGLARSFHNGAVTDTQALRRRRMPRLLRLAGHRAMPSFFDMDDTAFRPTP